MKNEFNEYLSTLYDNSTLNEVLKDSINYSLLADGKRLRPLLFFNILKSFGITELKKYFAPGAALEMVHTYSLIHDDLPAMDNDQIRRGNPTNHVLFGADIATLAGDALLTDAFKVLAQCDLPAPQKISMVEKLSEAAGSQNMISGQVEDLKMNEISISNLKNMHFHKTAAMFIASGEFASICLDLDKFDARLIRSITTNFGLAFQLADDIADLEKEKFDQNNFAADFGIERTYTLEHEYIQKIFGALNQLKSNNYSPEPLKTYFEKCFNHET